MRLELNVHKPTLVVHTTPILFVHGAWYGAVLHSPYFVQHGFTAYAMSLRGHGMSEGRSVVAQLRPSVCQRRGANGAGSNDRRVACRSSSTFARRVRDAEVSRTAVIASRDITGVAASVWRTTIVRPAGCCIIPALTSKRCCPSTGII